VNKTNFMFSKVKTKKNVFGMSQIYVDSTIKNVLMMVGLSLCLSFLGTLISSDFNFITLLLYLKQPLLIVLNTLPLTIGMLCIYFLTSRAWISYLVAGGCYFIAQLVNFFKISLRYEPLFPSDILLGNESTNVIKMSELPIGKKLILLMILYVVGGVLTFLFIKSKPAKWLTRGIGVLISVIIFVGLYNTCYKNTNLYNKFEVNGTIYSSVDIVRSRGFVYSFLVKANSIKLTEPEGYSAKEAEKVLKSYAIDDSIKVSNQTIKNKMPHVIAIMSEAFFDIDRIPGVKFDESNDPLKNFNRISNESYHGKIVTSVFGGGTSHTECAFLTGISMSIANWTADTYSAYIRKDTFSLARVFKNKGYTTTSLHPGYPWFYNRFNVYEYFGFDNRFFKDNITEQNTISMTGYITDMDTYKFLMKDFQNHLSKNVDTPYFNFTVTIENHGPYATEPIGYPKILKNDGSLSDENYNLINNYVGGLKRNDEALGYLVGELEKSNEPVVLLYFGDHLPLLGNDFSGYKAMNYNLGNSAGVKEFLNTYETPYFIWSNKPAKELLEQQGKVVPVGEAQLISANYLATELLNYIGIKDSDYFNYLNNVKASIPVITNRFYKTSDGNFTENLSDKDKDIISEYRNLQYYMLFDNKN
jgi:phosphoglycerol transferase MdoB-like AlkP superfamily enzyme